MKILYFILILALLMAFYQEPVEQDCWVDHYEVRAYYDEEGEEILDIQLDPTMSGYKKPTDSWSRSC